jgi:hypothetical protein
MRIQRDDHALHDATRWHKSTSYIQLAICTQPHTHTATGSTPSGLVACNLQGETVADVLLAANVPRLTNYIRDCTFDPSVTILQPSSSAGSAIAHSIQNVTILQPSSSPHLPHPRSSGAPRLVAAWHTSQRRAVPLDLSQSQATSLPNAFSFLITRI